MNLDRRKRKGISILFLSILITISLTIVSYNNHAAKSTRLQLKENNIFANDFIGTCSDNYHYSKLDNGVGGIYTFLFKDDGYIKTITNENFPKEFNDNQAIDSTDTLDEKYILDHYHIGWLHWTIPSFCLAKQKIGYSINGIGSFIANIFISITAIIYLIIIFLYHFSFIAIAFLFKITGILELLQFINRLSIYLQLFTLSILLAAIILIIHFKNQNIAKAFNDFIWILLFITIFSFFTVSASLGKEDSIEKRYILFLNTVNCIPMTFEDALLTDFFKSNDNNELQRQNSCFSDDLYHFKSRAVRNDFDRALAFILYQIWSQAIFHSKDSNSSLQEEKKGKIYKITDDYFIDTKNKQISIYLLWAYNESSLDKEDPLNLSKTEASKDVNTELCYNSISNSDKDYIKKVKEAVYKCITDQLVKQNTVEEIQNPSLSIVFAFMALLVFSILFYLLLPALLASVTIAIVTLIFFFIMPIFIIISLHQRKLILKPISYIGKAIITSIFYLIQGYIIVNIFLYMFKNNTLNGNILLVMLIFCMILLILFFIKKFLNFKDKNHRLSASSKSYTYNKYVNNHNNYRENRRGIITNNIATPVLGMLSIFFQIRDRYNGKQREFASKNNIDLSKKNNPDHILSKEIAVEDINSSNRNRKLPISYKIQELNNPVNRKGFIQKVNNSYKELLFKLRRKDYMEYMYYMLYESEKNRYNITRKKKNNKKK